jgi:hypothetical protein
VRQKSKFLLTELSSSAKLILETPIVLELPIATQEPTSGANPGLPEQRSTDQGETSHGIDVRTGYEEVGAAEQSA